MSRTVQVKSPSMPSLMGGPAFEFKSLKGGEQLGQLFSYSIELQTPDTPNLTNYVNSNIDVKALLGKEFSVIIETDGLAKREINGIVTSSKFVRGEERRSIYCIQLQPWGIIAARNQEYRVFQKQSLLQIVQSVLANYSWPTVTKVSRVYPIRDYVVQFGESNWTFVNRLMQEIGVYHYWEHADGTHRLVLVDDAGAHTPNDGKYAKINFYGETVKADEEYCNFFELDETHRSGQVVTRDHEFRTPKATLQQLVKMPRNHGSNNEEVYYYPSDIVNPSTPTNPDEGRDFARIRMEELGAPGTRGTGTGNLRGMVTGRTFTLAKHPHQRSNQDYLIIASSLSLHESAHASGQGSWECEAKFTVQPAKNVFRTPQTIPKPRTTGPMTAVVTGPAGSEIYTDEFARVKLSFPWHRQCTKDENSSCWVRVSSVWAGSNFGFMAVPRVGQEVIVEHELGDLDRPLVTGRLYNQSQMPPWSLPGNMTQTGILTRSSMDGAPGAGMHKGGGNANALRFEDKKGQEQLWIHAEKDQLTEVENDEDKWVGQDRRKIIDRDEFNTIHRDRTEIVDRNEKINVHGWRTEEVDLDETITIHKNRIETVDLDETVTVHKNQTFNVDLNRTKKVGVNETDTIGNNWKISTGKMKIEKVGIGNMENIGVFKMVNIGMAYNLNVGAVMMTNVGMMRMDNVGKDHTQKVGSDQTIDVGKNYKLIAGDTAEIVCGGASIKLEKSGDITISGKTIKVVGTASINYEAPKINEN